jgi:WhiB family transcriptional regulator, redox-sensing transcriptional regulator
VEPDPRILWLMGAGPGDDLEVLPPAPDWQRDAACLGADPAMFFPERGERGEEARRLCASCPVVDECLDLALEIDAAAAGDPSGIFAGLSPNQRKQYRATGHRPAIGVDRPRPACSRDGCDAIQHARGLCTRHYRATLRRRQPTGAEVDAGLAAIRDELAQTGAGVAGT